MFNKKSFTLVEILVITTIVVLFTGTLLASYNNFNQQKNSEKEINRFVDVLSLAKSKAQSADIYFGCSGSDEFGGYTITVNDSDYNFKQCCRDVATKNPSICGSVIQTYDFPSSISNISGPTEVNFYPLAEGATPINITIKNTAINKCSDISISETGVISAADIQSC